MSRLRSYLSSASDRRPCTWYTLPMLLYVPAASRLFANASSPSAARLMSRLRSYLSSASDRRPCTRYTSPMLWYVLEAFRLVSNSTSPSAARVMVLSRSYISSASDRRPCAWYTQPSLLYVSATSRLVSNASLLNVSSCCCSTPLRYSPASLRLEEVLGPGAGGATGSGVGGGTMFRPSQRQPRACG